MVWYCGSSALCGSLGEEWIPCKSLVLSGFSIDVLKFLTTWIQSSEISSWDAGKRKPSWYCLTDSWVLTIFPRDFSSEQNSPFVLQRSKFETVVCRNHGCAETTSEDNCFTNVEIDEQEKWEGPDFCKFRKIVEGSERSKLQFYTYGKMPEE